MQMRIKPDRGQVYAEDRVPAASRQCLAIFIGNAATKAAKSRITDNDEHIHSGLDLRRTGKVVCSDAPRVCHDAPRIEDSAKLQRCRM
jgi:hypothetical protein